MDETIRISVRPEPTDEELAAVAAVVGSLLASSQGEAPPPAASKEDRWARMGRREALRDPFWPPDPQGQE